VNFIRLKKIVVLSHKLNFKYKRINFMSSLDSLDNAKYSINRFIGPVITIILGIFLYSKSKSVVEVIQKNPYGEDIVHKVTQEPMFGYAGLFFILVGILWFLYIFNVLKSIIGLVVMLGLFAFSAFILYTDYTIVKEDVDFKNKKDRYMREIKGRLNDVKLAEIEYKKEFGRFTPNLDSLTDYIKNGKTISYKRYGQTPARPLSRIEADYLYPKQNIALDNDMTDVEAKTLSLWADAPDETKKALEGYVRDTVYVSVLKTVFEADSYKESRNKKLELDFHPDSLRYIPFSGKEIEIDTASISRGDLVVPTLLIRVIHPDFLEDTLEIGDLNDNSLKDNWSLK